MAFGEGGQEGGACRSCFEQVLLLLLLLSKGGGGGSFGTV